MRAIVDYAVLMAHGGCITPPTRFPCSKRDLHLSRLTLFRGTFFSTSPSSYSISSVPGHGGQWSHFMRPAYFGRDSSYKINILVWRHENGCDAPG
jgi:hypothetical protein